MDYPNEAALLSCCTSNKERVNKIDEIIAALFEAMLTMAPNSGLESYKLDDGQTKIQRDYKDSSQITKTIEMLQYQRNYYLQACQGGVMQLVSKDLIRRH